MSRIYVLVIASLVVAGVTLGGAVARADWDEDTSLTNTLPQSGVPLADNFFHVEWTVGASRQGQSRVTGYVYNDYGQPAINVHLQITGMAPAGQAIESSIRPVSGTVLGNSRAYFDFWVPSSSSYRVSVASFDFIEFPGA